MQRVAPVAVVLALLALAACEGEVATSSAPPGSGVSSASASASASATVPRFEVQENEFSESERSRDPFRSALDLLIEKPGERKKSSRVVKLSEFAVSELKLVGLVTNTSPEMALLVDPKGKGHSVSRGEYLGRSEIVQSAGKTGAAYEVNWRVDRIRDGSIVLVREDPRNPDVPSATKVITLRPDEHTEDGDATL